MLFVALAKKKANSQVNPAMILMARPWPFRSPSELRKSRRLAKLSIGLLFRNVAFKRPGVLSPTPS